MRAGLLVCAMMVVGCAQTAPTQRPDHASLRSPAAPIASQIDADLARLAGSWRVVSYSGDAPRRSVTVSDTAIVLDGQTTALTPRGNGRFAMGKEALWVFWLDGGNRTAALGSPDGTRVWIMDRTGQPRERRAAAQTILDWYGFDVTRMEDV